MSVDAQNAISSPAALDRPFYFIVVLWGERFRRLFPRLLPGERLVARQYTRAADLTPQQIPDRHPPRRLGGDARHADVPLARALRRAGLYRNSAVPARPLRLSAYEHRSPHRLRDGASRQSLCRDPHAGLHALGRQRRAPAGACATAAPNSSSPPRCASARSRFWRTCAISASCRARAAATTAHPSSSPDGRWSMPPSMASTAKPWPMSGMRPASWPSARRRGGACPAKTASCCIA